MFGYLFSFGTRDSNRAMPTVYGTYAKYFGASVENRTRDGSTKAKTQAYPGGPLPADRPTRYQ